MSNPNMSTPNWSWQRNQMNKPKDPRKHGLKQPEKIINVKSHLSFPTSEDTRDVSFIGIVEEWAERLEDHLRQGHTVTKEPTIGVQQGFSNTEIRLYYSFSYPNVVYDLELATYEKAIAKFAEDLLAFNMEELKIKNHKPDLSAKIERAKQRLANLEASQAGKPLPFPESGM
jgi:hypothetical protein